MNRLPRTIAALTATAALAVGGAASAQAKHGADDPVGHEAGEHAAGVHHHRHGGRDHARASAKRHGNDDGAGHKRHGNDDGPNHS